ncbi:MAG TPA: VOC family protein [Propionibacteriaceae bacterium]|nr:VOC family protein [Propionibacteriaceae bacterium]
MTTSPTHERPVARLSMVNIDCPDPRQLAVFYGTLLGWQTTHSEDEYAMIVGDSTAIGFGRVDPFSPPSWPDEAGAKEFHLDLAVEDLAAAEQLCRDLGATVPEHQPGEHWKVLLDPAGHPFCLSGGA